MLTKQHQEVQATICKQIHFRIFVFDALFSENDFANMLKDSYIAKLLIAETPTKLQHVSF